MLLQERALPAMLYPDRTKSIAGKARSYRVCHENRQLECALVGHEIS